MQRAIHIIFLKNQVLVQSQNFDDLRQVVEGLDCAAGALENRIQESGKLINTDDILDEMIAKNPEKYKTES